MKDHMKLEFVGKDFAEVINKILDFLNTLKGINVGEAEGSNERQGSNKGA